MNSWLNNSVGKVLARGRGGGRCHGPSKLGEFKIKMSSRATCLIGCDCGHLRTHKWECPTVLGGWIDKTWKRDGWMWNRTPGVELTGETGQILLGGLWETEEQGSLRLDAASGCCGSRASRWRPGPRTAGQAGVVMAVARGRSRAFSYFHGKPLPVSWCHLKSVVVSCPLLVRHGRQFWMFSHAK